MALTTALTVVLVGAQLYSSLVSFLVVALIGTSSWRPLSWPLSSCCNSRGSVCRPAAPSRLSLCSCSVARLSALVRRPAVYSSCCCSRGRFRRPSIASFGQQLRRSPAPHSSLLISSHHGSRRTVVARSGSLPGGRDRDPNPFVRFANIGRQTHHLLRWWAADAAIGRGHQVAAVFVAACMYSTVHTVTSGMRDSGRGGAAVDSRGGRRAFWEEEKGPVIYPI